jgi:hypothetical protein
MAAYRTFDAPILYLKVDGEVETKTSRTTQLLPQTGDMLDAASSDDLRRRLEALAEELGE